MPQFSRQKDHEKLFGTDMVNNMEIIFHTDLKWCMPCTASVTRRAGSWGPCSFILVGLSRSCNGLTDSGNFLTFPKVPSCSPYLCAWTRGFGKDDHEPPTWLIIQLVAKSMLSFSLRDLAAGFTHSLLRGTLIATWFLGDHVFSFLLPHWPFVLGPLGYFLPFPESLNIFLFFSFFWGALSGPLFSVF